MCTFSAVANNAIICPTVEEIKKGNLGIWLPLYQDNEELASSSDTLLFESHVEKFDVARWSYDYAESGHCFYKGSDPILKQIVLAQDAWRPLENQYWTWIKPNKFAECHSDNASDCGFIQ